MGSAVVPVAQEVPEHMLVLVIQKLPFTQNQATQHRAMLQLTDQVIQNRVTDQLMHQDILNLAMLHLVTLLLKLQVMPQDILNLVMLNLVTLRDTLQVMQQAKDRVIQCLDTAVIIKLDRQKPTQSHIIRPSQIQCKIKCSLLLKWSSRRSKGPSKEKSKRLPISSCQ